MTITPELEACARAIAEVRERWKVVPPTVPWNGLWSCCASEEPIRVFGDEADCQAFLDMEAACVCLLATLPVSAGMVKAALEDRAHDDEGQHEPLCNLIDFSGENKTRTVVRSALEAAIRHIVGGAP